MRKISFLFSDIGLFRAVRNNFKNLLGILAGPVNLLLLIFLLPIILVAIIRRYKEGISAWII